MTWCSFFKIQMHLIMKRWHLDRQLELKQKRSSEQAGSFLF